VESVHIDTPKPAAPLSRRLSRTKKGTASDSETEGDEQSKRRKVIENADTLGAISEEKTEAEITTAVSKQETPKDDDEDLEIIFETSVPARKVEEPVKPATPSPEDKEIQKIEKLAAEKEEKDCSVIEEIDLEDGEEVFATPEAEENIPINVGTEVKSSPVSAQPQLEVVKEPNQLDVEMTSDAVAEEKSKPVSAQSQKAVKETSQSDVEMTSVAVIDHSSTTSLIGENASAAQESSMDTTENSVFATVVEPEPSINQNDTITTIKVDKKVTKKTLSINERLAKLAENKAPVIVTQKGN
jgi:hypothetical protein